MYVDMQKLFHVYLITNLINQKVYVGKTCGNPKERWKKHIKIAEGKGSYGKYKKYPIHSAIAKYGISNFSFVVLESFCTEDDAYISEIYNIQKFNSIRFGYNLACGGQGAGSGTNSIVALFSNEQIKNIFQDFISGMKGAEIARKYNCTKTSIYDILDRITYCSVNIDQLIIDQVKEIKLTQRKTPTHKLNDQDIANDYLSGMSYREIASKYNSSTFTIRKIIVSKVDQSIIDKNKMQIISQDFGNQIIQDYISTDLTAQEIGARHNVSKYVIYDILRGKTFNIDTNLLRKIKEIKRMKSAKK